MAKRTAVILWILFFGSGLFPAGRQTRDHSRTAAVADYQRTRGRAIIEQYLEFLAIPNVSADRENIRRNAVYIQSLLTEYGITARILPTPGNPVVYGEYPVKGAETTLLFYAHYDGQPVDPEQWTGHHPFQPVLRAGKLDPATGTPPIMTGLPESGEISPEWRIYARGSADDKAPILCMVRALDALAVAGYGPRSNLKFIFEGEEEAGSPHMESFLREHRDLLAADLLFMCDGPGYFSGDPTLFFGVRGITSLQITLYGPVTSLHSGHYGNWAPNPAQRLARLLATMKDGAGEVLVEGFYDSVVPLTDSEKAAIRRIPAYDEQLLALYRLGGPENPDLSLLASLHRPSLNINGLASGWVGEEARTIVPATATASLDIRLVKGNGAQEMVGKVADHIRKQGYHVVTAEPDAATRRAHPRLLKLDWSEKGYPAYRTALDSPMARATLQAFTGWFERPPVAIPTLGGSLPISRFADILEVPVIGVPVVNYDNNQHQPDENVRIGHLWDGMKTFAALFMGKFKKVKRKK